MILGIVFLCKADDGIRYCWLSRGVGDVDNRQCIGSRLVGSSVVSGLIRLYESLNILGGIVSGEGGQHQYVVGDGGILLYLAQDAVQTVSTKEINVIGKLAAGLGQEGGSFLSVEGDEHQLDAGVDQGVDLGGEIGLGSVGEGLGLRNGDAGLAALFYKGIVQADGIVNVCLLYNSDADEDLTRVALGGRRITKIKT